MYSVRLAGGVALIMLASASALAQERSWEGHWSTHPMMVMWGAGGLVMMLMMLVFWGLVIVRCGLAPARVGATLVSLELAGHARQLEGQRWVAVGARARRA